MTLGGGKRSYRIIGSVKVHVGPVNNHSVCYYIAMKIGVNRINCYRTIGRVNDGA